jgi:hypothetical protein
VAAVKWLQRFLPQESNSIRVAGGLAIAGHVIIVMFLLLGASQPVEPVSAIAIPVEIAMEKPEPPPPPPSPPAPSPAKPSPEKSSSSKPPPSNPPANNQSDPSGVPAVADVEKHAKAPRGAKDVNSTNLPKQAGHDGADRSAHPLEAPQPAADAESSPDAASAASDAMHVAPVGSAQPEAMAQEPGEDELTAIKEEKLECGLKAKRASPAAGIRNQARVIGFVTQTQTLAMIRSSQILADRHINPHYLGVQHVFAETLDGVNKFTVALPSGLSVNVGDVVEVDQGHIDPHDPCQYVPNLAVGKL